MYYRNKSHIPGSGRISAIRQCYPHVCASISALTFLLEVITFCDGCSDLIRLWTNQCERTSVDSTFQDLSVEYIKMSD